MNLQPEFILQTLMEATTLNDEPLLEEVFACIITLVKRDDTRVFDPNSVMNEAEAIYERIKRLSHNLTDIYLKNEKLLKLKEYVDTILMRELEDIIDRSNHPLCNDYTHLTAVIFKFLTRVMVLFNISRKDDNECKKYENQFFDNMIKKLILRQDISELSMPRLNISIDITHIYVILDRYLLDNTTLLRISTSPTSAEANAIAQLYSDYRKELMNNMLKSYLAKQTR